MYIFVYKPIDFVYRNESSVQRHELLLLLLLLLLKGKGKVIPLQARCGPEGG